MRASDYTHPQNFQQNAPNLNRSLLNESEPGMVVEKVFRIGNHKSALREDNGSACQILGDNCVTGNLREWPIMTPV